MGRAARDRSWEDRFAATVSRSGVKAQLRSTFIGEHVSYFICVAFGDLTLRLADATFI